MKPPQYLRVEEKYSSYCLQQLHGQMLSTIDSCRRPKCYHTTPFHPLSAAINASLVTLNFPPRLRKDPWFAAQSGGGQT